MKSFLKWTALIVLSLLAVVLASMLTASCSVNKDPYTSFLDGKTLVREGTCVVQSGGRIYPYVPCRLYVDGKGNQYGVFYEDEERTKPMIGVGPDGSVLYRSEKMLALAKKESVR